MEDSTQILEINLISAQNLKTPATTLRRVQTYAVAWVDPSHKLRTRTDSLGGENPTWNDKFLFRVPRDFISRDTSAVEVQIFAVGYVRDLLIGTVRFLLSNCLGSSSADGTPSFTAVQVRRPSGRFQGVLNVAAAVGGGGGGDGDMMGGAAAVSVRELTEKRRRRWSERLSFGGSKRWDSWGGEWSDGSESAALKEWNCVREMLKKSDGGKGMLCGLGKNLVGLCPSDQNVDFWEDDDGKV